MVIEPIINMHKVKYVQLKPIIDATFSSGESINIYMNLDAIFKYFYAPKTVDAIKAFNKQEYIAVVSEIINLAAHYRHFFWKHYRVSSRFYFYYTKNRPIYNVNLVDSYMKESCEQKSLSNPTFGLLNRYIQDNLELFKLCVKYIPDVYYIETGNLEPAMVPYYIINKFENDPSTVNLLLSKDVYEFQMIGSLGIDILRLKYNEDTIVNGYNLYQYICDVNKSVYRPSIDINPELFPAVLATGGVKTRDIKGLSGYGYINTIKKLESAIIDNRLRNEYYFDPSGIADMIIDSSFREQFINNYKAIDLKNQFIHLSPKQKDNIESMLINRYDNDSLMKLNDDYFSMNPIDLLYLTEGVDLIGNWKRNKV